MHHRHENALERVRAEGRSVAESARGEVVEPLKEEVERMRQQLEEAQAMYEVNTGFPLCEREKTEFRAFCWLQTARNRYSVV